MSPFVSMLMFAQIVAETGALSEEMAAAKSAKERAVLAEMKALFRRRGSSPAPARFVRNEVVSIAVADDPDHVDQTASAKSIATEGGGDYYNRVSALHDEQIKNFMKKYHQENFGNESMEDILRKHMKGGSQEWSVSRNSFWSMFGFAGDHNSTGNNSMNGSLDGAVAAKVGPPQEGDNRSISGNESLYESLYGRFYEWKNSKLNESNESNESALDSSFAGKVGGPPAAVYARPAPAYGKFGEGSSSTRGSSSASSKSAAAPKSAGSESAASKSTGSHSARSLDASTDASEGASNESDTAQGYGVPTPESISSAAFEFAEPTYPPLVNAG